MSWKDYGCGIPGCERCAWQCLCWLDVDILFFPVTAHLCKRSGLVVGKCLCCVSVARVAYIWIRGEPRRDGQCAGIGVYTIFLEYPVHAHTMSRYCLHSVHALESRPAPGGSGRPDVRTAPTRHTHNPHTPANGRRRAQCSNRMYTPSACICTNVVPTAMTHMTIAPRFV